MTTEATARGRFRCIASAIRASAQAIWDAITSPDWTSRYGYGAVVDYELRPGGRFRPSPATRG